MATVQRTMGLQQIVVTKKPSSVAFWPAARFVHSIVSHASARTKLNKTNIN